MDLYLQKEGGCIYKGTNITLQYLIDYKIAIQF